MDQGSVVGVPDDKGNDAPVTQIQDGAQVELAHVGARIVVKLRHIGEPLFVGAVGVKLAVQHILRQLSGGMMPPECSHVGHVLPQTESQGHGRCAVSAYR